MVKWIGLNKKLLKWHKLQVYHKVKSINGVGIKRKKIINIIKINKVIHVIKENSSKKTSQVENSNNSKTSKILKPKIATNKTLTNSNSKLSLPIITTSILHQII